MHNCWLALSHQMEFTCGMAIGARQAIPEVFQKGLIY